MRKAMLLMSIVLLCALGGLAEVVGETFGAASTDTVRNLAYGKIASLTVYNAEPSTGTVVLSQIVGLTTNQLFSVTATNGTVSATVTNAAIVSMGDVIVVSGTATSGVVRVLFDGGK